MDSKAIIIIGLLFLLASTSAFVVNIQGDTVYNLDMANVPALQNGLSIDPQTVPRYCDVKVMSAPNKQIKVYSRNYADTGLGCKTNSNGVCTFRFTSNQVRGTYYVSGNNLQVAVVLEPTASCKKEISVLYIDPTKLDNIVAGMPYYFTTSAYTQDGSAVVPEPVFSLTNNSVGVLSQPSTVTKNQVQFVGYKVGATMLKAEYSGKVAFASIKVAPGRCNAFTAGELSAQYVVGSNITISAVTTDLYNNTKPDIAIELEYTSPNGTKVSLENYSDSNGIVTFTLPIGNHAGTGRVTLKKSNQFLCPSQSKEFYFNIVPDVPALVIVAPSMSTLNVHEMVRLNARVYDQYMNEITDKVVNWSIDDATLATFAPGTVQNSVIATAQYPGTATITATTYYDSITMVQQCIPTLGCINSPSIVQIPVSGTAQLNVRNGNASYVVIQPVAANVIAGAQQQFTATLYDQYSAVVPKAVYSWSAVNGTINANGLYTAPQKAGDDIVTVTSNGVSANATVTVTNGPAANITIMQPEGRQVPVNTHHVIFVAVADQYGNAVPDAIVNYKVLSGTSNPSMAQLVTGPDGLSSIVIITGSIEENVLFEMSVENTSLKAVDTFNTIIPNASLSGVVTEYYSQVFAPVQDVLVYIEGTPYSAITNASGNYNITNINLNGNYSIIFSKVGYKTERVDNFQILKDDQDNNYTQNIQLRILTPISGSVKDENGQLMPNANVTLYENGVYITSVLTDANGHYEFNVAPNSASVPFLVTATAPGYDTASAVIIISPGVPVVLDLTLSGLDVNPPIISWLNPPTPANNTYQSGNLQVATLAADPNYAATVITVVNGSTSTQVANCAIPVCNAAIDTSAYPDGQLQVIAIANDTRGNQASVQRTYNIDNVLPVISFVAPTPPNGSTQTQPFTVAVNADDETGVTKIVIDLIIGGSTMHLTQCNNTNTCSYDLNNSIYSGMLTISATAYSGLQHASVSRTFTVIAPQQTPTTLQLSAAPAVISTVGSSAVTARVLDQHGNGLPNQQVQFTASGGNLSAATAITNASGHATVQFSSAVVGNYSITATAATLTNTTNVAVMQLSGNGQLNGVVSNTTGSPIQGANVTVMKNYAVIFSTTTDATGAFSFNLPADSYDVVVTATGYLPIRDYGVRVLEGGTTTKNYVLTKMSRLYGNVSNSTGEAVSGATLKAYRNGNLVATTTSLTNGNYEFILPSGVYTVETTHPDYQRSLYTLYLPPTTELAKNVVMYR